MRGGRLERRPALRLACAYFRNARAGAALPLQVSPL